MHNNHFRPPRPVIESHTRVRSNPNPREPLLESRPPNLQCRRADSPLVIIENDIELREVLRLSQGPQPPLTPTGRSSVFTIGRRLQVGFPPEAFEALAVRLLQFRAQDRVGFGIDLFLVCKQGRDHEVATQCPAGIVSLASGGIALAVVHAGAIFAAVITGCVVNAVRFVEDLYGEANGDRSSSPQLREVAFSGHVTEVDVRDDPSRGQGLRVAG